MCSPTELAALARAGDLEVLDRMSRCMGARLMAVGRARCRSVEEAEDAVQDAIEAAGRHLSDWRGDGALDAWLVRMVANACGKLRRGRKNDPGLHETELELADLARSPELEAARAELAEVLADALESLDPRDRALVMLSEVEGWTAVQLAEQTGMTHGQVRTRLSRARARLRDRLGSRIDQIRAA